MAVNRIVRGDTVCVRRDGCRRVGDGGLCGKSEFHWAAGGVCGFVEVKGKAKGRRRRKRRRTGQGGAGWRASDGERLLRLCCVVVVVVVGCFFILRRRRRVASKGGVDLRLQRRRKRTRGMTGTGKTHRGEETRNRGKGENTEIISIRWPRGEGGRAGGCAAWAGRGEAARQPIAFHVGVAGRQIHSSRTLTVTQRKQQRNQIR